MSADAILTFPASDESDEFEIAKNDPAMTGQLARRFSAVCVAMAALAAAACTTLPSAGGAQAQRMESTPINQPHFWGALSEEPDAPPSQA